MVSVIRKLGWLFFGLMWIPFAIGFWNYEAIDSRITPGSIVDSLDGWLAIGVGLLVLSMVCFAITMASSALLVNRIVKNGESALAKVIESHSIGKPKQNEVIINYLLEVRHRTYPAFETRRVQSVPLLEASSSKPGDIVGVKFIPGSEKVVIVGFASDPPEAKKAFELGKKGVRSKVDFRSVKRKINPLAA